MYARDCSNKIKAVLRAKGERGERLAAWIAYGYMRDPDNSKKIIPDPETAPVVKHIFEMYASGIGIKRICGTLERDKTLSPSVYNYRKYGSRARNLKLDKPYAWTNNTIRKMLSNQIYCGDTVNFKTYSKSNKLKNPSRAIPKDFKREHAEYYWRMLVILSVILCVVAVCVTVFTAPDLLRMSVKKERIYKICVKAFAVIALPVSHFFVRRTNDYKLEIERDPKQAKKTFLGGFVVWCNILLSLIFDVVFYVIL